MRKREVDEGEGSAGLRRETLKTETRMRGQRGRRRAYGNKEGQETTIKERR